MRNKKAPSCQLTVDQLYLFKDLWRFIKGAVILCREWREQFPNEKPTTFSCWRSFNPGLFGFEEVRDKVIAKLPRGLRERSRLFYLFELTSINPGKNKYPMFLYADEEVERLEAIMDFLCEKNKALLARFGPQERIDLSSLVRDQDSLLCKRLMQLIVSEGLTGESLENKRSAKELDKNARAVERLILEEARRKDQKGQ